MALINKIREKSSIAVIFVAVALISFIVGDYLTGSSLFSGGGNQNIGEISGETITAQEFQAKLDEARTAYEAQTGRAAQETELQQLREQVWNQYLFDYAYKKEYEALGLTVTDEEKTDIVQGNNISPIVRQNFGNPQTEAFDKTAVISYLKTLKNAPIEQQKQWERFEQSLAESRLREKFEKLLTSTAYVTKAEAEKEYQAQAAKASLRYLYVPFYSISDSTVKVEDSELSDYLAKHKEEYKGFDSRNLKYVTFNINPSKDDSSAMLATIKSMAKGLATATNDSTYARANSDVQTPLYWSISEMPAQLKAAVKTFIPNSVNGPYQEGDTYFLYKYLGTRKDTVSTAKASHILISTQGMNDSAKATARTKAEDILRQLQGGASFEALAASNSQDGSAQNGGDLGYFKEGAMVKPFNDAVFGAGVGLIGRIVESDFGFHIIKVTEAKSNVQYKIAAIGKSLGASQGTRDASYAKADQFSQKCRTVAEFDAETKANKALIVSTASRVTEGSSNINTLQNAREIVRWAFNDDTNLNEVSQVFETNDQYVVAVLTGKTEKDNPKAEDFKDELTQKVRNEKKAEQILKKLGGVSGKSLEEIAQKYGAGALVETANDITLATGFLTSAGIDPIAIGKGFGLQVNKRSKHFKGDNGVFIMEKIAATAAPAIADYSLYKSNLAQKNMQAGYLVNEAIKENAKITDNRAKFF